MLGVKLLLLLCCVAATAAFDPECRHEAGHCGHWATQYGLKRDDDGHGNCGSANPECKHECVTYRSGVEV